MPTQDMGFTHVGYEAYMKGDDLNQYTICYRESKEVKINELYHKCANQYYWPFQWSIKDHLFYYGQCSGCTQTGCDKYT